MGPCAFRAVNAIDPAPLRHSCTGTATVLWHRAFRGQQLRLSRSSVWGV